MRKMMLILGLAACGEAPVEGFADATSTVVTSALRPKGLGANAWTVFGAAPCVAADKEECVNEVTADDTRGVFSNAAGARQTFDVSSDLADFVPVDMYISRVTVTSRFKLNGPGGQAAHPLVVLRLAGTDYVSNPINGVTSTFADSVKAFDFTPQLQMRPGVVMELGVECWTSCVGGLAPSGIALSQISATVTYNMGPGS
jgi:hypothetical protein